MSIASALQRKELNAIEQARAFRAILDAGDAAGPTELARMLGLSQGHVSNTLRLLELPDGFRQRVISGEIPAAHARALLPWRENREVMDLLAKKLPKGKYEETADDFADEVWRTVRGASCSMVDDQYDYTLHTNVPPYQPTEAEREQLRVIELPTWDGAYRMNSQPPSAVAVRPPRAGCARRRALRPWIPEHDDRWRPLPSPMPASPISGSLNSDESTLAMGGW